MPEGKLIDQSSAVPTRKVTAGGVGGALSIVLVWLGGQLGIDMPPEVASAFTTLIAGAAAWFTTERYPVR